VLWNLDEIDSEKCAERLADLALVELDLGRGHIQIHDVIRQFLTSQLADAFPVHARLVAGEATLMGHTAWVLALTRLADQRLVSASRDKTIRLWNPSGYAPAGTLEAHGDWVRAVTPVGPEALASGSDDCTIRIWWIRNGRWQSRVAFVADSGIKSLAFSEPDATLLAGDASGRIHFLKLSGLQQVS
jgi:WD40 repeat protein